MKCSLVWLFLSLIMAVSAFAQTAEISIQTGHIAAIKKIVFSEDGNFLASADEKHKICIWDMMSFAQMSGFFVYGLENDESIISMAFTPDHKYLLNATSKGKMLLWSIENSAEVFRKTFETDVRKIHFISNTVCLLVSDKLYLFDITDKRIQELWEGTIADLYLNKNEGLIHFLSYQGDYGKINADMQISVNTYDSLSGNFGKLFKRKFSIVARAVLSPDYIAISDGMTSRVYDFQSGEKIFMASAPYIDEIVTDMVFLTGGTYLISSNSDGKIYVYNYQIKKVSHILNDHLSNVNTLAVHPYKNIFASGSTDRSIILWDANTFKPIRRFYARATSVECLEFSTSKNILLFGNELGYTKMIDLNDDYLNINSVRNHRQKVTDIQFCENETSLITCSHDNHLSKINLDKFEIIKKQKFKSNFGTKYMLLNILEKFDMYVNPFIFIEQLEIKEDSQLLLAKAYKTKSRAFSLKKQLAKKQLSYQQYYYYSFRISDLKRVKKEKLLQAEGLFFNADSIIEGVPVYNPLNGHISRVTDFVVDKKNNRIITSSEDASIKLWDINTRQLIMTIIPVDKDKRIFLTADNYYYAPKNALNAIGFKVGNQFFPPEQFDLKYNRPDIVMERMGNISEDIIQAYRMAYQKRLKKMNFTEEMLGEEFHLPEISIRNASQLPLTTQTGSISLELEATDSRYPLDRINVWLNDVPLFGMNGLDLREENNKQTQRNITIDLAKGTNKISVSANNQKGAESLKKNIEVFYEKEESKPDLYVVSIGASIYKDNRFNLNYAAKDANDFIKLFLSNKQLYNDVKYKLLTDQEVTKENMEALKLFLSNAKRDDVVIIFIAGHGVLDESFDYYFATYDMDFNNPKGRGMSYDKLESLLDGLQALKKILFMDTCHSGELDKEDVEVAQGEKSMEGAITFRSSGVGVRTKTGFGVNNTSELMKEMFTDLRQSTGSKVISSSGGAEFAMESGEWKNGLFTFCLLSGISEKKADLNKDKKIMLSELHEYVRDRVTDLSGGLQKPSSRYETYGFDFQIW